MAKNFKELRQSLSLDSQRRAEAKANKLMAEILLAQRQNVKPTNESIVDEAKFKKTDDSKNENGS